LSIATKNASLYSIIVFLILSLSALCMPYVVKLIDIRIIGQWIDV
jgi:hypothetical protein